MGDRNKVSAAEARALVDQLRREKPDAGPVADILTEVLDEADARRAAPAGVRTIRSSKAWGKRLIARLRAAMEEVLGD